MKPHLLKRLVCPLDRTSLELRVWEEEPRNLSKEDRERAEHMGTDPAGLSTEILTGVLVNHDQRIVYPIYQGVPRMLTFPTDVGRQFWDQYAPRIRRELGEYRLPSEACQPGESDVLRTFSSEWVNFDWDGTAYWDLTPEGWFKAMRYMLDLERQPVDGKVVLEAGIGIGALADYMAREEGCELIGLDLGYAVDVAFRHFRGNSFLHVVQASVFAPPFRDDTFDFVYSWGVLHHTHSTADAFRSLSKMPKEGGRFYMWVYSPYDEQRNFVRRNLMRLETVLRPVMWRLPETAQSVALSPLIPLYMAHQWWQSRRGRSVVRYGLREAMHAARDRFTPRFVGRHTDEEVRSWFRKAGYDEFCTSLERPRPDYVPLAMMTCTGVSGIRHSTSLAHAHSKS